MLSHSSRWSTFRGWSLFPRRSVLRRVAAVTTSLSLLPFASGWSTIRAARSQSLAQRAGSPRPGKPEGSWPSLEEVQREGKREAGVPGSSAADSFDAAFAKGAAATMERPPRR